MNRVRWRIQSSLPRPVYVWAHALMSSAPHDLQRVSAAQRGTAVVAGIFGVPTLLCLWLYVLFYKRDNLLLLYLPVALATVILVAVVQHLSNRRRAGVQSRALFWSTLIYTLICLVYRAAAPLRFDDGLNLLVALQVILAGVLLCLHFPPIRAGVALALMVLLHSLPLLGGLTHRTLTGRALLIGIVTELMLTALLALMYSSAWTQLALRQTEAASLQMKYLSQTDHLTGLANRRNLYSSIEALMAEVGLPQMSQGTDLHASGPQTFSLALLDIDHFKSVNDTFGHAAGDAVLCSVAEVLQSFVRRRDLAGRWGGEEFVLVLPGVPLGRATQIAERLRQRIETAQMLPGSSVTASFGVTGWQPGDSLEALMARADSAMYRAKQQGRNRVEVSGLHVGGLGLSDPAAPEQPPIEA